MLSPRAPRPMYENKCASASFAFQQDCCYKHRPRRNSNICNCCSLRLIQRQNRQLLAVSPPNTAYEHVVSIFRFAFTAQRIKLIIARVMSCKGDPFKSSVVEDFIPPVATAKALSNTTTDRLHHHGSFLVQYCQGQAQEITVEVILCKYSRH